MRLSTKEDIEAPVGFVYKALVDHEGWERAAMRRGADVMRTDQLVKIGPGMSWNVKFTYRGKMRVADIRLTEMEPEQRLAFSALGAPVEGVIFVDLAEMGPRRTRVTVVTDVKPRTLAARLVVQSLRLAKAKVQLKFNLRVARIGADIEDRYRAQGRA